MAVSLIAVDYAAFTLSVYKVIIKK